MARLVRAFRLWGPPGFGGASQSVDMLPAARPPARDRTRRRVGPATSGEQWPPRRLAPMSDKSQAEQDAHTAWSYAVNMVIREDQGKPAADVLDDYARYLLEQTGAGPDRLMAAARQACIDAAEHVAHPGQWRPHLLAVELCRYAAQLNEAAAV
jgi:hypothetical protein